jgi:DNA polymerase
MPISNCPDVMSIDFETRSTVDLRKAGVNVYVEDPTTDVWCLSYGTKPNQIDTWVPDQYHPDALANHVATGGLVSGWNVAFELAVWNRILVPYYGFPALDHRQCIDTQAMAQARGFPAALGECADAMRLPVQKDKKGQALMMRMCRPRKVHEDGTLEWWDDQARVDALIAYCEQDVRTEMAVFNMLPRLSGSEQLQWELNYQINERGVPIDLKLLHGAMKIAHDEGMALNDELKALSKGAVSRVTEVAKLRAYLEWLGVLDLPESLDKSAVMALLARDDLSVLARRALEIRQEAGKSSLGKLKAMKARMNSDHRIRGTIKFHGASSTGRFSGAGIQIQNFPRDSVKPAAVLDLILDGDRDGVDLFASKGVLPTLSAALRNMITAPEGRVFGVIDYSQIESRATAWLANDFEKLDVRDPRGSGRGGFKAICQDNGVGGRFWGRTRSIGRDGQKLQSGL